MKSYQQTMDHTCGACCVQTVLAYFGLRAPTEKSLAHTLKATFLTGIEPRDIEAYLRDAGLTAQYRIARGIGELITKFKQGWLPIICWADWDGHYCVVVEYVKDPQWSGGRFKLADPAAIYEGRDGFTEVAADRLKAMWYTPHTKNKREVVYVKGRTPA